MTETESAQESAGLPEEDVLKVLLATDIHLGYEEKDPIRDNDSFIAFEEILVQARRHDVDFILLGGDLFHDANPSQSAINRCIQLLRTYSMGDRIVPIEFLSEQSHNFHDALNGTVNYEDPNMNIAYPVFSVHGNHDDPNGFRGISSMDLLHTSGMVNYFGKCTDLTQVHIKPILLRKGKTQLAMYGLSHIKDARLHRLFKDSKVTMEMPPADSGKWFNLLVLHQNRADRGVKNYIPENILPDFLDLILWGHEHDCRVWAEENPIKNFYVTQPGSSVATSLSEGEAIDKHIGLLHIFEQQFKLTPIKLETVRPFIFRSYALSSLTEELGLDGVDDADKVRDFAKTEVEDMIEKAKEKLTGHEEQPTKPLIRLRLLYDEEEQMFNAIRFGQQFNTLIANPTDCLLLKRNKTRTKQEHKPFDPNAMKSAFDDAKNDVENLNVEDIVERYFTDAPDTNKMEVLLVKNMSELSRRIVQDNDDDAADRIITYNIKRAVDYLNEKMPDEDGIEDELANFRAMSNQIYADTLTMLDNRGNNSALVFKTSGNQSVDVDDKENTETAVNNASSAAVKATGRGTRGGKAATTTATRKKPEPKSKATATTAKGQPTIQQAMSQTAAKSPRATSRKVVYNISSDDSD